MKTRQLKLPFPRGARVAITCPHPEKKHFAKGLCASCYAADYRAKNIEVRREQESASQRKHYVAKPKMVPVYRPEGQDDDWSLPEEIGLRYAE